MKKIIVGLMIFCFGCESDTKVKFSTYWWKYNTDLNVNQKEFIDNNQIQKVYLRIFDLKWDEYNKSITVPKVQSKLAYNNIIVLPVIFIENKVLSNNTIDTISTIIFNQLDLAIDKGIINATNYLQVDCDWTISTKEKYFLLLKILSNSMKDLSATIRLHQIKYSDATGIPPVKKGVLMIYNLESLTDTNVVNSIFSYDKAVQYLNGYISDYPLQLDLALPAFSWGVHFHYGKIKALLSDFNPNDIDTNYMSIHNDIYFKSKQAHFYNTHRISNRDEIRYEYPNITDVSKMLSYLVTRLDQDSTEVIFFSLNSEFLINNNIKYEKIISTYR